MPCYYIFRITDRSYQGNGGEYYWYNPETESENEYRRDIYSTLVPAPSYDDMSGETVLFTPGEIVQDELGRNVYEGTWEVVPAP